MFFAIIFVAYLLLNLYVYLRCRRIIFLNRHTLVFTIFFALLTLAFPVAEILSHGMHREWMEPVLTFGFLTLPFLLYLFLLVLLLDLFLGLNRLLGVVPVRVIQHRTFRLVGLSFFVLIPLGFVIAGKIRYSDIRMNHYRVEVPAKSSSLRHLKIALASDFHLDGLTDESFLDRFATDVNSLNADLLLIPGDLFEGSQLESAGDGLARYFRGIRTTYGVYASLGNHEGYGRLVKAALFERAGITLLRDTAIEVPGRFILVGRKFDHHPPRKSVQELMSSASGDLPSIVLDHSPTDIDGSTSAGADILVSGHTHQGQLFPFNLITEHIYRLSWGHEKINNTHVFVTSGVRLWGPPVRTAGDSEIMVIDVTFLPDSSSAVSGGDSSPGGR